MKGVGEGRRTPPLNNRSHISGRESARTLYSGTSWPATFYANALLHQKRRSAMFTVSMVISFAVVAAPCCIGGHNAKYRIAFSSHGARASSKKPERRSKDAGHQGYSRAFWKPMKGRCCLCQHAAGQISLTYQNAQSNRGQKGD